MRQSDISLDKYWETQSGYFRLATTVALGMGIIYGKLLYCHGVAEGNKDKKISTFEYNNRTVYQCLNNPFTADCGSLAMHLPPITIDDRPPPHKRARYDPNLHPATISVASENSVSTLTTTSDLPDILPTDVQKAIHVLKKGMPVNGHVQRGYCCRKHGQIIYYKKKRFFAPHAQVKKKTLLMSGFFQYYCSDKYLHLGTSPFYVTRLR